MKKIFLVFVTVATIICASCTSINKARAAHKKSEMNSAVAKNIVFMIVDGMGFEHVKAARIYNGQSPLAYEKFPCSSSVTTCAYDGAKSSGECRAGDPHVTDSAAAATAIATGVKVSNGVISKRMPGESSDVESILEQAKARGKSTGVIATKLFTDATPAAFASHAHGREQTTEILQDMFQGATPNVVFGADTPQHREAVKASSKNYMQVHGANEMEVLAQTIAQGSGCTGDACPHVYGGFGQYDMIPGSYKNLSGLPLEITPAKIRSQLNTPKLSQMTKAALDILAKNERGFFLMVESSMPDMISHYSTQINEAKDAPSAISSLVREMQEVENTIKVLERFIVKNPNTLVVLTADHETGGLVIEEDKTTCLGKKSCIPSVKWTSNKYEPTKESPIMHTNANVPLYAIGVGAKRFCKSQINNIDIKNLALTM